ncbi:MAG: rbsA [Solirubrobacterales bacterium]|jgi:ABC-type sugar transport system ATPase subunit|nr:rbsA [Solirubrobacterales bacterium]
MTAPAPVVTGENGNGPSAVPETLLEGRNLSKAFPGVVALDDVSVAFGRGEVHGLVGENGAGKSTLLKVLSGIYLSDAGEIRWEGEPVSFKVPPDAVKLGIEVIPQELSLAPGLSAAENIMMGIFPARAGRVRWREVNREAKRIAETIHLDIDVRRMAASLSPAEQRLVMIARALARNARLVIMDEPTVSLAETEVTALKKVVKRLQADGVTVVYVSHRLDEVLDLTDRITVMKDGRVVGTSPTSGVTKSSLIEQIIGHSLAEQFPDTAAPTAAEPVLRVRDLSGGRIRDVSFELRPGEILGLAGLVGSGRSEVVRMVFGADPRDAGVIEVAGKVEKMRHPRHAIAAGLALLPEDRRGQGAVVDMSIAANVTLPVLRRFAVKGFGFVRQRQEAKAVKSRIERLGLNTPSTQRPLKFLSGGNQQKALVAKWELSEASVFIFDEPTAGVDVGAKQEIYGLIAELARGGAGIILISSELEEIVGLAHRVIVMREGEVAGELQRGALTESAILNLCFAA